MNKLTNILLGVLIILKGVFGYYNLVGDKPMGGSYPASSFDSIVSSSTPVTNYQIMGSQGELGSVIVTDAGIAGGFTKFYDGTTTTGVLNRLIATLPSDIAAGTYIFNADLKYGLLWTNTNGALVGTTTITFAY